VISKQSFVNFLHEKNFYFKRRGKKMELYRQRGTGLIVQVPPNKQLDDKYVILQMIHLGCNKEEIQEFVRAVKACPASPISTLSNRCEMRR